MTRDKPAHKPVSEWLESLRRHPDSQEISALCALMMVACILVRPFCHRLPLYAQAIEVLIALIGLCVAVLCMESIPRAYSALYALVRRQPGFLEVAIMALLLLVIPSFYPHLPPASREVIMVVIASGIALPMGCAAIRCRIDPFAWWLYGMIAVFWGLVALIELSIYILNVSIGINVDPFWPRGSSFPAVVAGVALAAGSFGSVISGLVIGMRKARQAVPGLVAALKEPRKRMRRRAATTLGNLAGFEKGLGQESRLGSFRRWTFGGTVEPSTQTAVPALQDLLQDKHAAVRREAAYALQQIESHLPVSGPIGHG